MADQAHETLTQDESYDLLSNTRRRFVIDFLRTCDTPVDVMALSRTVAARENNTDPDDLTDPQVKRVYVSLHQTHIPKLANSGVVTYDKDASTVALTGTVAELDAYLPYRGDDTVPWPLAYVSVATGGLILYGVAMLAPIGVPPAVVGLLVITVFAVLTGTHYVTGRNELR